jgi:hypothetical protein
MKQPGATPIMKLEETEGDLRRIAEEVFRIVEKESGCAPVFRTYGNPCYKVNSKTGGVFYIHITGSKGTRWPNTVRLNARWNSELKRLGAMPGNSWWGRQSASLPIQEIGQLSAARDFIRCVCY